MDGQAPDKVTQLLRQASSGNRRALDEITPLVYDELRRRARARMVQERPGHTLQATALAHEVFLRLVDQDRVQWQDRAHFFAIASQAMRRILVDHARKKRAAKRGGSGTRVTFNEELATPVGNEVDVEVLNDALESLKVLDPRQSRIVELRFFGGLTEEEIAEVLGISIGTVKRDWRTARAWLSHELMSEGKRHGSE
jgi:RNA polymerase sigma factor (TIGR02999 family)